MKGTVLVFISGITHFYKNLNGLRLRDPSLSLSHQNFRANNWFFLTGRLLQEGGPHLPAARLQAHLQGQLASGGGRVEELLGLLLRVAGQAPGARLRVQGARDGHR